MKAIVKKQKGEGFLELTECAMPKLLDNEVLIQVAYAGICGTDMKTI